MKVKTVIVSGFLGAGKSTLIRSMAKEHCFTGRAVLLENDYGPSGIDEEMQKDCQLVIKEMTAGCICCTAAGVFLRSLSEILDNDQPELLLIEPAGTSKVSDILTLLNSAEVKDRIELCRGIALADASRFDFQEITVGEYLRDQIRYSDMVLLTKTEKIPAEDCERIRNRIHEINSRTEPVIWKKDTPVYGLIGNILEEKSACGEVKKVRQTRNKKIKITKPSGSGYLKKSGKRPV